MAFVRTKRFKKKNGKILEYAYIVENRWMKRGNRVKQKTKKYLGRVYKFDKIKDIEFFDFHNVSDSAVYFEKKTREEIVRDLVKWELARHGFSEKDGKLIKDDCVYDVKEMKIFNQKGNGIALAFNEGFLSNYSISKILNFNADVEEDAYDLAKLFIESGIAIPQDVFVGMFSKYNISEEQ
jgi:hypothetical protein